MKERILQVKEWTQMNQRDFAKAINISPASLSSIVNGRTSPTNKQVQAIHRRFPEVNILWLLFGEGEMLQTSSDSGSGGTPVQKADIRNTEDRGMSTAEAKPRGSDATPAGQEPLPEGVIPGQYIIRETVKYIDKPQRRITEIHVFYDDGTFETFSARKD